MVPYALAAINKDPALQRIRFDLVPAKIKEEDFWCSYFYRVYMIKQAYNVVDDESDNVLVSKEESTVEGALDDVSLELSTDDITEELKRELENFDLEISDDGDIPTDTEPVQVDDEEAKVETE